MHRLPFRTKLLPFAISQVLLANSAIAALVEINLDADDSLLYEDIQDSNASAQGSDILGGTSLDEGIAITLGNNSLVSTLARANGLLGASYAYAAAVYGNSYDDNGNVTVTLNNGASVSSKAQAVTGDYYGQAQSRAIYTNTETLYDTVATVVSLDSANVSSTADVVSNQYSQVDAYGIYSRASTYGDHSISIDLSSSQITANGIASGSDSAQAEATSITLQSENKYADIYSADNTVTLSSSTLEASALAISDNSARAYAAGIDLSGRSYDGTQTIDLDNSSIVLDSAATSGNTADARSNIRGIYAYNYAYNGGAVNITLNNDSTISGTATADASAGEGATAYAEGIRITNISYNAGNNTETGVTLNNSTIDLTADATGYDDAQAYAEGITSISAKVKYGDSNNTVSLNDSSITLNASATTGANATSSIDVRSNGIDSRNSTKYYDSTANATITLNESTIDQTLNASQGADDEGAQARAYAVSLDNYAYYGGASTSVTLNNSAIQQSVTASGNGNEIYAESYGVYIENRSSYDSGYNDATVNLDITASSIEGEAFASSGDYENADVGSYSYGIDLVNNSANTASTIVTLSQSDITNQASTVVGDAYDLSTRAGSEGIEIRTYGQTSETTVTISNSNVTSVAQVTAGDANDLALTDYAQGYAAADTDNLEVDADAKYGGTDSTAAMTVNISDSEFIARSTITAGSSSYLDADAENIDTNVTSYANATNTLTLNNVQVTGDAIISSTGRGDAINGDSEAYTKSELVRTEADVFYSGGITETNRSATTTVTLSDSTLEGTADSELLEGDYNLAYSEFFGVRSGNYLSSNGTGDSEASTTITLTNTTITGSSLSATSTGDYNIAQAEGFGIRAESRLDVGGDMPASTAVTLDISLTDSSINVNSEATGATGATASGQAGAEAIGIYAEAQNYILSTGAGVTIDLNSSSIDVSANATMTGGDATANAKGIYVQTGGTSTINLNDSEITTTADASGAAADGGASGIELNQGTAVINLANSSITANGLNATGIMATGATSLTVNLDGTSSIIADTTVLGGAGSIVNNGGLIEGDIQVATLSVSGTQRGTGTVGDLSVANTGSLSVNIGPSSVKSEARFTATNATLTDGATVEITGVSAFGSAIADPNGDTSDYLIVTADSLTGEANFTTDNSLIEAERSEAYTVNDIAVSFSLADFGEVAATSGATNNGQSAASGSESALVAVSGTTQGDELFEALTAISDNNQWDQLSSPAHGGNVLSLLSVDRLLSQSVNNGLSGVSGESSGDHVSADNGFWAQVLYTEGDMDSLDGVSGFDSDTTGVTLGYGRDISDHITVGGALTYADTDIDGDANDSVDTETWMASIYTQYQRNQWFSNAILTYGAGDNDSERYVTGDKLKADYDSEILSLLGVVGYDFEVGEGWLISPRVEYRYASVDIDSYKEEGGLFAQNVSSQDYDLSEAALGAEFGKAFETNAGVFTPYIDLAVYQELSGDDIQITSRFAIGGDNFVANGADTDDTSYSATVGTDWTISDAHSLRIDYQYFGNDDFDSDSIRLRYNLTF